MSKFNVGDKVRVASYAETVSSGMVMSTAYGLEGVVDGYDSDGDVEVHFDDHQIQFISPEYLTLIVEEVVEIKVGQKYKLSSDGWKKGHEVVITSVLEGLVYYKPGLQFDAGDWGEATFLDNWTLVQDVQEDFKVGDYLTEKDREVAWKVSSVAANGAVKTEALILNSASDTAGTIVIEKSHQKEIIKATPEQIAAFDNHPFWGVKEDEEPVVEDAISPSVYQFPNGVEVRDISAHLSSFGGQAVQYIARATRLDGVVKGKPVEDLLKSIELLQWEAERLEALEASK